MGKLPDKQAVVYAIRCSETGRVYIGSTTGLASRLKTHMYELRSNGKRAYKKGEDWKSSGTNAKNSVWQQDFNKYGYKAFEVYILEENVQKKDRAERETYWMDVYNSTNPEFGYNLKPELAYAFTYKEGLPPVMSQLERGDTDTETENP